MQIITTLRSLIGEAPPGMEWLEYLFAMLITLFGLLLISWLISMVFKKFNL